MLNEKIINIDYEKVDKAIKECQEPIIIMVGNETAMALISESEENNDIKVAEQEFEELITYKGIPITVWIFSCKIIIYYVNI